MNGDWGGPEDDDDQEPHPWRVVGMIALWLVIFALPVLWGATQ
jgi:hypothetical protein